MPNLALPLEPVATTPPSTCTLYHGDCLEIMPTLAPKSVAMVFADLPYGLIRRAWDTHIDLRALWPLLVRCGVHDAKYIFSATQPYASDLIVSRRKSFRYDLIWDKSRVTGFLNANRMPLRQHEHILIFAENSGKYNPQMLEGRPWQKKAARKKDDNYNPVASNSHAQISDGQRYPTSVLKLPSSNKGSLHPTQKPDALLEWLIKSYTNEGDTVLDPVFGSATTAIACARLGRHFVGIEKDREYFRIGTERVNAERAKLGLAPCEVMR